MDPAQEQQLLEKKTGQALAEGRTKLDSALEHLSRAEPDSWKKVWLAEEAAEYSSLLYSLTYGLEDENPPTPPRKRKAEPTLLATESSELLRQAMELRLKSPLEGYRCLRTAVDKLRQSHHILEKEYAKKKSDLIQRAPNAQSSPTREQKKG